MKSLHRHKSAPSHEADRHVVDSWQVDAQLDQKYPCPMGEAFQAPLTRVGHVDSISHALRVWLPPQCTYRSLFLGNFA